MSKPSRYLVLLRGINVGGNNIIKMVELKACIEQLGFTEVKTYIQSGNVLFTADQTNPDKLEEQLEQALSKQFNYKAMVVVVSESELEAVVSNAPAGFGQQPDKFRYDVLFLKRSVNPATAIKEVPTKEGVDQLFAGQSVLYFSRLTAKATQSKLNRVVQLPIYQQMTIRNWNTTTKLLALIHESGGKS